MDFDPFNPQSKLQLTPESPLPNAGRGESAVLATAFDITQ
jgi:hypothetical protein